MNPFDTYPYLLPYKGNPNNLKVHIAFEQLDVNGEVLRNEWATLDVWTTILRDPGRRARVRFVKLVDLNRNEPQMLGEQGQDLTSKEPGSNRIAGLPPIVEDSSQCPLCGFIAKNNKGLRLHKAKKHDGKEEQGVQGKN